MKEGMKDRGMDTWRKGWGGEREGGMNEGREGGKEGGMERIR